MNRDDGRARKRPANKNGKDKAEMTEIGRIESLQKMACPTCRSIIALEDLEAAIEGDRIRCVNCGQTIKLPDEILDKIRKARYIGNNLDITC